jgi:hypothetical protein
VASVVVFGVVFVGFFVLRGIAATITFYFLLPEGGHCPMCDEETIRVQSPTWNRLMPWFRTSWCFECGWDGLLRASPKSPNYSPIANNLSQSGQLPLSSKKSSK